MDKVIEYIWENYKPLGIILIGVGVITFFVDAVNSFIQIGLLTSSPLRLLGLVIIIIIFGRTIGWDSEGYYSPRARRLARFLVLVSIPTLALPVWDLIGASFHSYENVFRRWFVTLMAISMILFFVIEHIIQKSKKFNILIFEFSEGWKEEMPKDRSIAHSVQEGLRKRFQRTEVVITPVKEVITKKEKAVARGKNAGAAAVIYCVYSKRQTKIKLELGFEVTKKPEYYQPVDLGTKYIPMEEFDTGHLEILIENDYANVINFLIGLSEYSSGDFKAAINTFTSLLGEANNIAGFSSLKPEILLLHLGNFYYSSRDIDQSKNCFEQALDINRNNPKARHNIGVIEYQVGNVENSIRAFSKAIALDDQLFVAYRNRAFILIQQGQHKQALADLSRCLELNPFDTDTLKFTATCHSNLGNHMEAIKHFKLPSVTIMVRQLRSII